MKRLLLPLTIIATAGILWGHVAPAHACSCAVQPVAERVAFYSHVVVGTVIGLTDDANEHSSPDKDALVSVERYLKGSGADEIVADDPVGGGDCGFFGEASVGRRYVLFLGTDDIFGNSDVGALYTHLCAGNEIASDALIAEVEAVTGPGVPPDDVGAVPGPGTPSEEADGADFPLLPVAVAAMLGPLGLLAGAAFVWRRP
jgi:hypothetical protein